MQEKNGALKIFSDAVPWFEECCFLSIPRKVYSFYASARMYATITDSFLYLHFFSDSSKPK
jgi:hypothetical protein